MRNLLAVAALVIGLPAAGALANEAPSFRIETIRVEGASLASERIVRAESLLTPGDSYSEQELHHAIRRIRRLPTVIDVDFRLERGSERGAYELVVTVVETTRFFFGADVHEVNNNDEVLLSTLGLDVLLDDDDCMDSLCDSVSVLTIGMRQPVGATGIAWVAVQPRLASGTGTQDLTSFELGYTQYDLFGTGAFANARAAVSGDGQRKWYTFEAGIPIRGDHSLRFVVDGFREDASYRFTSPTGSNSEHRGRRLDATLEWRIDSRDDPLFPSDGRLLSTSLHLGDRDRRWTTWPDTSRSSSTKTEMLSLDLAGTWYHPIDSRRSVSWGGGVDLGHAEVRGLALETDGPLDLRASALGVRGLLAETDAPSDFRARTLSASAEVGYQQTVWHPGDSARLNDLRWQTSLSGVWGRGRLDELLPDIEWSRFDLSTSLVLRNRWGVARLSLVYRNGTERYR